MTFPPANLRSSRQIYSFFSRLLGVVTGIMNATGTVLIFALMVLVNTDIIMRGAMNAPVRGVAEIVSLSIVGIVFLQLAHTLRVERITRADLMLNLLRRREPRLAEVVIGLFNICGAAIFAILAATSWPSVIEAYARGHYLGSPGDFTVPIWPVRFLIVFGSWMMVIQYLVLAIENLATAFRTRVVVQNGDAK